MSLEQFALAAEIIGAIAIIVTLIYLAIQVKDSARASRSAAVTDATTAMQAVYQELGGNPQAARVFLEGLTKPDTLSEQDQFQYLMMMHSFFLGFQRSFFLAQQGTLDIDLRDSIGTALVAVNQLPGIHLYWRQRKAFFQPEFIAWVERLLAEDSRTDMDAYRERLMRAGE